MATAILIFFIAAGLIGSLFPVIPGTAIIFAGAVIHAVMTGFKPIQPAFLAVMAALLLIANIGQYFITGFGAKKSGATKYGVIGACLGSMAGFFFLPIPGGLFLGAFLGAFLFEVGLATSGFKQSVKAGAGAAVGTFLSFFFEFAVSLLMALLIAFQVSWI
jgi:uncharacterized protein YqgC (DUF456 family)